MSVKLAIALVAAVLAVVGNLPYLVDTVRRRIQPHPYTWLVWSIVSCITFFGQLQRGGGYAVIATGCAEVFTILIFLASLRNGFSDVRRIDTVFLVIALAGLVPWYLTKDPTASVVAAVGIDLVAFVPTLRKAWRSPASENPILYAMNVVRHVLVMASISHYNVATTLHSISMICTNTAMVSILLRRRPDGVPAQAAEAGRIWPWPRSSTSHSPPSGRPPAPAAPTPPRPSD